MASRNPFALLSDEPDASDNEQQTLPKVTKPTAVDAAPKNNKPARTNPIPGATTRRSVPGQTTVRPQKEATELPASDAPAGDKAQFEGERGRDTRVLDSDEAEVVQEVLEEAPTDLPEVTAQREAVEADLLVLPDPTDTLRPAKSTLTRPSTKDGVEMMASAS